MSKAIWCDRCKSVCSEQSATHIDTKWAFVIQHLDLCPKCAKEFRIFIYGGRTMTDREKLVELLKDIGIAFPNEVAVYLIESGVTVCKDVNVATTDVPDSNIGKWIPVTERLPQNPKERVIVKIKDAHNIIGDPDMDTDRYVVDSWVRWGENVTHWMPLPEPPKEKK